MADLFFCHLTSSPGSFSSYSFRHMHIVCLPSNYICSSSMKLLTLFKSVMFSYAHHRSGKIDPGLHGTSGNSGSLVCSSIAVTLFMILFMIQHSKVTSPFSFPLLLVCRCKLEPYCLCVVKVIIYITYAFHWLFILSIQVVIGI